MASSQLTLRRGNSLIINYTNQDNSTPAQPISLLGSTLYFTVKSSPGYDNSTNDSTAVWQISSTGNTGNIATFISTPENTWVAPATYYWDVTIEYADGSVVTPLTGTIKITGIPTNRLSQ